MVGCAQVTKPARPPSHSGSASYEALPAQDDRRYQLEPGDAVEQPLQVDNTTPQYPPALLTLELAPLTLDVRVVMDASGAVNDCHAIAPSDPASLPHGVEFLAAICTATSHWRFTPLRVRKTIDVDENGDGEVDSVRQGEPQALPFSLDYRFRFAVIDGKGQVQLDRHDAAR